jgi:ABC-type oligopeptide transport system substrate-binding subunit
MPSPAAPASLTFHARLHDDLGSLDWGYGEVSGEIVYQMMDGLFRADGTGKPVPAVAKSFSWNAEKTELKLHLGASRWSDGQDVCAKQFVDAWDRLRDKKFASPYAHYAAPLESFEAKGCKELTVRFRRPAPEGTALLAHYVFFPVRLDVLEKHPKVFLDGDGLVVNGAYRLREWQRNSKLTLERNPRYEGRRGKLDRIEYFFIPDDTTAKAMFDRRELDWVKEVPQLLRTPELEKSPEFRVFPSLIVYYFGLNAKGAGILADVGVRRLLAASLDRAEIPKILGRECRGTSSWLVSELLPGRREAEVVIDPKARERLVAAFRKGNSGLKIYTYSKTSHKLLAEWAQGQWEKHLGVRIPLVVEESRVYWKDVSANPLPIFFGGVTAPFGHPRAFLQEFLAGASANWTGWSSPEYDAAVAKEDFARAEAVLEREAFVIPLYQRDTVALVQKKWKGFHINPLGQVYLADVR